MNELRFSINILKLPFSAHRRNAPGLGPRAASFLGKLKKKWDELREY